MQMFLAIRRDLYIGVILDVDCRYELQSSLRLELESLTCSSEAPEEGAIDELVDEVPLIYQ